MYQLTVATWSFYAKWGFIQKIFRNGSYVHVTSLLVLRVADYWHIVYSNTVGWILIASIY
jgi:hypothetical protein